MNHIFLSQRHNDKISTNIKGGYFVYPVTSMIETRGVMVNNNYFKLVSFSMK